MDIEQLREFALSMAGVTEDQAFGDDILNFRVGGKIFLCLWLGAYGPNMPSAHEPRFAIKLSPERNLELRAQYQAVVPAYHWNKKHWSDIYYASGINDELVRSWIEESYLLVVSKLPKAVRLSII